MTWLFVELITIASWLSPEDPAWVFMCLLIALLLAAEGAALALIIGFAMIVERWRDGVRVTTDWRDDPAAHEVSP